MPAMLGEEIKKQREKRGWSQQKLGEKLGVSYATIQQWEKGQTAPKRTRLAQVCRLLDIPPEVAYGVPITSRGLAAQIAKLSDDDRAYLQRIIDALAKPPAKD